MINRADLILQLNLKLQKVIERNGREYLELSSGRFRNYRRCNYGCAKVK